MSRLTFYYGIMGGGKSTLALQMYHNFGRVGRSVLLLTRGDRSGATEVSSRVGLTAPAIMVDPERDLFQLIQDEVRRQRRKVDDVICDEAQFYTPEQIEQLGHAVDVLGVDVHAFGLKTDFRSRLFAGSQRLMELADQSLAIQSGLPCWCGQPATQNARVVDGRLVMEGEQVVIGDLTEAEAGVAQYVVLCRKHYYACQPYVA